MKKFGKGYNAQRKWKFYFRNYTLLTSLRFYIVRYQFLISSPYRDLEINSNLSLTSKVDKYQLFKVFSNICKCIVSLDFSLVPKLLVLHKCEKYIGVFNNKLCSIFKTEANAYVKRILSSSKKM